MIARFGQTIPGASSLRIPTMQIGPGVTAPVESKIPTISPVSIQLPARSVSMPKGVTAPVSVFQLPPMEEMVQVAPVTKSVTVPVLPIDPGFTYVPPAPLMPIDPGHAYVPPAPLMPIDPGFYAPGPTPSLPIDPGAMWPRITSIPVPSPGIIPITIKPAEKLPVPSPAPIAPLPSPVPPVLSPVPPVTPLTEPTEYQKASLMPGGPFLFLAVGAGILALLFGKKSKSKRSKKR